MEENIRELIDEVEPKSILPIPTPEMRTADPLAAIFSVRDKVFSTSERVPPWWSVARDQWLFRTMLNSDVLAGAAFSTSARLASIPVSVVARDRNNRNHRRIARWSSLLLEYNWQKVAFQMALEWQTQDNGVFVEVLGGGDPGGPIEPTRVPGTNDYLYALGLRVLDSQRATRTGHPDYPVVYRYKPPVGPEKYYKFHKSRILFMSQMPIPREEMLGIGYCASSRIIRQVLRLEDIDFLEDEMLGARPLSQIIFSRGISATDMEESFAMADVKAETANAMGDKRRTSRSVFVSAQGPPDAVKAASIETFDLKRLPEGYDPEVYMNLAMNIVAMGFGFDPREFWPATVRGATRADAEVQHWKSMRKTPGLWVNGMAQALMELFVPNVAVVEFDQQDDEQDRLRAEIRKIRSEVVKDYMDAGVLTEDVAWQIMLSEGDLTEEQYSALRKSEQFEIAAEMRRSEAEMLRNQAVAAGNTSSGGANGGSGSNSPSGGGGDDTGGGKQVRSGQVNGLHQHAVDGAGV